MGSPKCSYNRKLSGTILTKMTLKCNLILAYICVCYDQWAFVIQEWDC